MPHTLPQGGALQSEGQWGLGKGLGSGHGALGQLGVCDTHTHARARTRRVPPRCSALGAPRRVGPVDYAALLHRKLQSWTPRGLSLAAGGSEVRAVGGPNMNFEGQGCGIDA